MNFGSDARNDNLPSDDENGVSIRFSLFQLKGERTHIKHTAFKECMDFIAFGYAGACMAFGNAMGLHNCSVAMLVIIGVLL